MVQTKIFPTDTDLVTPALDDLVMISDTSEGGKLKEVVISAVSDAGIARTQTLTNKTLTKPTVNGSINGVVGATDGATITFDLSASDMQTVTLGGNRTLALSNVSIGQVFSLRLLQDGTGTRTVTWFSTIKRAGGVAPTLTTTINKADMFVFVCTGSGTYDGFIVGQNI